MTAPAGSRRFWNSVLRDSLWIFVLAVLLVWPLFRVHYFDNWGSIEATFIADARFLAENWPHPRWQPLWYGGTRFDYIYPPALRYGTAGLAKLLGIPTAHAYHVYTALLYCAGIAGVYVLARLLSESRLIGWLATAATALYSPTYWFLPDMRRDVGRFWWAPKRLDALVFYGEGPHISALSVVGFALAAGYWMLTRKSRAALALTACLAALAVSNNFYGAVALVTLFGLMFWALWVTRRDHALWLWAAAAGVLGYALTAFWLTPSYLRITQANLVVVGAQSQPAHLKGAIAVAVAFLAVSFWIGHGRPERWYAIFVSGAVLAFAGIILAEEWFGVLVIGAPTRVVPEMDLALILAWLEAARWLWRRAPDWLGQRGWVGRVAVTLLVLAPFVYWRRYLFHAWGIYHTYPDYHQRVEYRMTDWIARNLPGARFFATGSLRYWYNAWHNLPQFGGGSEQGVLNHGMLPALGQVPAGESGEVARLWMVSFGVDAVAVHEPPSEEVYHDFPFPKKFVGVLPVLYDDGQGNVIYRVPRRYPGLARVVEKPRVEALRPVTIEGDIEGLRAYTDAIENGPDALVTTAWEGSDVLRIRALVYERHLLLVQVSYDPAWRAYSRGRSLPIRKDVLGQMLIEAPPGEHDMRLVFELPLENLIGRIAAIMGAAVVLWLFAARRRRVEATP